MEIPTKVITQQFSLFTNSIMNQPKRLPWDLWMVKSHENINGFFLLINIPLPLVFYQSHISLKITTERSIHSINDSNLSLSWWNQTTTDFSNSTLLGPSPVVSKKLTTLPFSPLCNPTSEHKLYLCINSDPLNKYRHEWKLFDFV